MADYPPPLSPLPVFDATDIYILTQGFTVFRACTLGGRLTANELYEYLGHLAVVLDNSRNATQDWLLFPCDSKGITCLDKPPLRRDDSNIRLESLTYYAILSTDGGVRELAIPYPLFAFTVKLPRSESSTSLSPCPLARMVNRLGSAGHPATSQLYDAMDSGSPSPTVKTPPDGSKMRLFHRDDTCVVCYAAGGDIIHRWYTDETSCFRGSHIFPLRYFELWDILQLGSRMKDPFTKPGNRKQDGTIVEDSRRMDSTDNGLILCGNHHILWNMMMFCIHPDTHCIAAFQPIAKNLHGLKITRPWENPRAKYPPPNRDILYRHFFSCIVKWMKGDRKDAEGKEADYDEIDPWDDVWDESRLPPRPVMEDYLAIRLAES